MRYYRVRVRGFKGYKKDSVISKRTIESLEINPEHVQRLFEPLPKYLSDLVEHTATQFSRPIWQGWENSWKITGVLGCKFEDIGNLIPPNAELSLISGVLNV